MSQAHFSLDELSAYLDGELELDESGQAHVRECPACARLYQEQLELRRLARATAEPVPTGTMWTEIETRIAKAKQAPAPRRFGWVPRAGFSLAGALTAAGLAFILVRPGGRRDVAVPAAQETPPANQLASAPAADRKAERVPAASAARARRAKAERVADEPAAPASEPAPAATASAPARAPAPAPAARPVFAARAFILTADAIRTENRRHILAAGRVVVAARVPGQPFVATVDGITRTVTGSLAAGYAEILNPGERLILTTGSAAPRVTKP